MLLHSDMLSFVFASVFIVRPRLCVAVKWPCCLTLVEVDPESSRVVLSSFQWQLQAFVKCCNQVCEGGFDWERALLGVFDVSPPTYAAVCSKTLWDGERERERELISLSSVQHSVLHLWLEMSEIKRSLLSDFDGGRCWFTTKSKANLLNGWENYTLMTCPKGRNTIWKDFSCFFNALSQYLVKWTTTKSEHESCAQLNT